MRYGERDGGVTCNKGPLPDLNHRHGGYVVCALTSRLAECAQFTKFAQQETLLNGFRLLNV